MTGLGYAQIVKGEGQIPDWLEYDDPGYFVGLGWYPILEALHESLVQAVPDYRVGQIKEKFGTLRCYIDSWGLPDGAPEELTNMLRGLVALTETASGHICERCGRPGRLRSDKGSEFAWQLTLCDEHAAESGYRDTARYVTGTGQMMHNVHEAGSCALEHCVIHNPSDHPMREFPTHWRQGRGIMERICPHGVGHPDPDDVAYRRHALREILEEDGTASEERIAQELEHLDVHGCDGCCRVVPVPYEPEPAPPEGEERI